MKKPSDIFRLRAISAEQLAHDAQSLLLRQEWEQIAIEWHAMAARAAEQDHETEQSDVA